MFAETPPACRFLSNKRGYEATFGRDLLDAGFDPRDVMDKGELRGMVVPVVRAYLDRAFPWRLQIAGGRTRRWPRPRRTAARSRPSWIWCSGAVLAAGEAGMEIGGRLVSRVAGVVGESDRRRLPSSPAARRPPPGTQLIADRLEGGEGVPVLDVGQRIAPEGAGRAEITNLAARHIHGLRSRLAGPGAIVTAHHAYRLAAGLRVGRVTARTRTS